MKNWDTLDPDVYALVGAHRYTKGRARPIDRIVIHHNAGIRLTTEDCKRLWDTSREASAHYQVEEDGRIGQLVNDVDTAWHAANADINARSIGIEHANISGPPRWQISDATIENGAHLVAALCKAYKLGRPQWGKNVFGHSQFASTSCPYQLAPGGEDHATYMQRAQYWYDRMTNPQPQPRPIQEENSMTIEKYVRDTKAQLTGSHDLGQYPGWPQLGGRTLVDAIAAIGAKLGIDGFKDPKGGK